MPEEFLIDETMLKLAAEISGDFVGTTDLQILTGKKFDDALKIKPTVTPTTDAAYGYLYFDSGDSNKPKAKTPAGTVYDLSAAATGEANTASNIGSAGTGVWKDKNGVDLRFYKLNSPTSTNITIALDAGNNKIDFTLGSNIPKLATANLFTASQTIEVDKNTADQLILKQPTNVVGDYAVVSSQIKNSTPAYFVAGYLKWQLVTNTTGAENTRFDVIICKAGTNINAFRVDEVGDLLWGANLRGKLSETGLTGARVFTYPDVTTKMAGVAASNTFTLTNTFQGKVELNKNVHLTGVISPTQITSDQNNYAPTNWATANVIRLDADASFRTITGIGDGSTQTDGQTISLRNISNNTILLKNQSGSSTAANRFDFGLYDVPLFSKQEITIRYDGTLSRWIAISGFNIVPTPAQGFYKNFDGIMGGTPASDLDLLVVPASGGTIDGAAWGNNHPGSIDITLGTSATGFGMLRSSTGNFLLGNSWYFRYECWHKIHVLSSSTPDYNLRMGFGDNSGGAEPTDGIYFRYNDGVNSGKWQIVCRNNGTETAQDSGITAQTSTFSRFTIILNPAGTSAQFFINGTETTNSPITTNIPTATNRDTGWFWGFLKTAGTTNTSAFAIDAMSLIAYAPTTTSREAT